MIVCQHRPTLAASPSGPVEICTEDRRDPVRRGQLPLRCPTDTLHGPSRSAEPCLLAGRLASQSSSWVADDGEVCIAERDLAPAAAGSLNSPFRGRTLTTPCRADCACFARRPRNAQSWADITRHGHGLPAGPHDWLHNCSVGPAPGPCPDPEKADGSLGAASRDRRQEPR